MRHSPGVVIAYIIFMVVIGLLMIEYAHGQELPEEVFSRLHENGFTLSELNGEDWSVMTPTQKLWLIRGYLLAYHVWSQSLYSKQEDLVTVYNYLGALTWESSSDLYNYTNLFYLDVRHKKIPLMLGLFHASPESRKPLHER